jgi:flavin-dependent dehydrogenase
VAERGRLVATLPTADPALGASRELLEWQLRARVTDAGVRFRTGQEVTGLLASYDRRTVTGVRVRLHRSGLPRGQVVPTARRHDTDSICADLVVDASGRTSKAARWLVTLGYRSPLRSASTLMPGPLRRPPARPAPRERPST